MAANIARPAGSKILPCPPFGRVINFGCIRTQRSGAGPEVPVEMCRRFLSLRRPRPHQPVSINCPGAVGAQVGMPDLSYGALFDPLHSRTIALTRGDLRAQLC